MSRPEHRDRFTAVMKHAVHALAVMRLLVFVTGRLAAFDPGDWMRDLREVIGQFPLTRVAIPGSHNSGSHAATWKSARSDDSELHPVLHKVVPFVVADWARVRSTVSVGATRPY